ncbi:hypothetical protein ACEPAH_3135 [Sanghuangporus vaninii]
MPSLSNTDVRESQTENISPPTDRASLRNFIVTFLKRCDIHYQGCEQPIANFETLCVAAASARGYLGGDDSVFRRFIGLGATIAIASYSHLRDENVKIYIALYTAFIAYLDDHFLSQIDAIREFVSRFVACQPQQLKVLDDFAALLLEMPRFHNAVACNIILTSTFDYLSSLLIQTDVIGVPIPTSATEYPMFFRRLSGIGNIVYCVCTFNDILSFYKEDLAGGGEDALVWLTARNRDMTVYESLCTIANETVDVHSRVLRILAPFEDAYEAYRKFARGFYGFHFESKRYKLQDLGL